MKKILILTHVSADFDAAASAYAASLLFENSSVCLPGSPNKNVREFLSIHADLIRFTPEKDLDVRSYDELILTDIQTIDRAGIPGEAAQKHGIKISYIFDHHPLDPSAKAETICVQPLGATTTLLVKKIIESGIPISPAEATFLALGIHEDTGSLTFNNTTPDDASALSWLYSSGANPEIIHRFLHSAFSDQQTALLIEFIRKSQIRQINNLKVLFASAESKEYIDGASAVVHRLMDIFNSDFTVVYLHAEAKSAIISRSSSPRIDSLKILKKYSPGGHPEASIAYVSGVSAEEVFKDILNEIEKLLRHKAKVSDYMSKFVITVGPETKISEVIELFKKTGHNGFPVMKGDKLAGIITRSEAEKAVQHNLSHAPVKGFMIQNVKVVSPDTSIEEAVQLITSEGIGRLPVVQDGKLAGIITRTDILRALIGDNYYIRTRENIKEVLIRRFEQWLDPEVQEILRMAGFIAEELGYRAFLVGGIVRDLILGYRNPDIDIVVEGSAIDVATRLARSTGARVDAYERFNTAVLIYPNGLRIDFATARTEHYEKPGGLPVVERSGIKNDLARRDFTINALAMSLSRSNFGEIIDVTGGIKDLKEGIIRVHHSLSFIEDPTRIVRAIRFEIRFGFKMERSTEALAREAINMGMVRKAAGVRMRDEILDLLSEEKLLAGIERSDDLGLLSEIIPGFRLEQDTRIMLRNIENKRRSRPESEVSKYASLAVLLLRLDKKTADKLLRTYKFNSSEIRLIMEIKDIIEDTEIDFQRNSEIYRYFSKYNHKSLIGAKLALKENSVTFRNLNHYLENLSELKPPVTGNELLESGLKESPALGRIKDQIFMKYLDGELKTKKEAIELAKKLAEGKVDITD